jgi:hypothetical protein
MRDRQPHLCSRVARPSAGDVYSSTHTVPPGEVWSKLWARLPRGESCTCSCSSQLLRLLLRSSMWVRASHGSCQKVGFSHARAGLEERFRARSASL